MTFFQMTFVSS